MFGKSCIVLRFCQVKKRCRLGKGMEGERTRLLSFVSEWSLYCLCVSQVNTVCWTMARFFSIGGMRRDGEVKARGGDGIQQLLKSITIAPNSQYEVLVLHKTQSCCVERRLIGTLILMHVSISFRGIWIIHRLSRSGNGRGVR